MCIRDRISAGGYNPPVTSAGTKVESYDGSTWTNETDCTQPSYSNCFSGSQTSAVKMGGQTDTPPVVTNAVETYDGSTWTTSPATLASARGYVGSAANAPSSSAGLIAGGSTTAAVSGSTAATEESRDENEAQKNIIKLAKINFSKLLDGPP